MIKKNIYRLLLACIIILFFYTTFLLLRNYNQLGGRQRLHSDQSQRTIITVDHIQPWMTFEYINRNFHLPNEYLKSYLEITAHQYPKITLHKIAKQNGDVDLTIVNFVKVAVRSYSTSTNIK